MLQNDYGVSGVLVLYWSCVFSLGLQLIYFVLREKKKTVFVSVSVKQLRDIPLGNIGVS